MKRKITSLEVRQIIREEISRAMSRPLHVRKNTQKKGCGCNKPSINNKN